MWLGPGFGDVSRLSSDLWSILPISSGKLKQIRLRKLNRTEGDWMAKGPLPIVGRKIRAQGSVRYDSPLLRAVQLVHLRLMCRVGVPGRRYRTRREQGRYRTRREQGRYSPGRSV